jgi:hypothetical protein
MQYAGRGVPLAEAEQETLKKRASAAAIEAMDQAFRAEFLEERSAGSNDEVR